MGWTAGQTVPASAELFLSATATRSDLGPTQSSTLGLWEIKRPEREADDSHQSIAEGYVNNGLKITQVLACDAMQTCRNVTTIRMDPFLHSTLNIEAIGSSETLVSFCQTLWSYIQ
jgi:hypothetical protein